MNPRLPPQSTPTAVWRQQLDALRQQAGAWWKERTPRERLLLQAGSALLIVFLVWAQGLRPALDTIAQSRELLPHLRAQAAQADALILEAQDLQRVKTGQLQPAELAQALRASLRRAGLEESSTLSETREAANDASPQWEIALVNANAGRAMQWLAGLPKQLRLQTESVDLVRANVDGRDRPGHVSGRIVVRQPAKQAP